MRPLKQVNVIAIHLLLTTPCYGEQPTESITHDEQHLLSTLEAAKGESFQLLLDLGFDSKYISEGRNNLEDGAIIWTTAALQKDALTLYATMGRGTQAHYIEWNLGLEYTAQLNDQLQASLGYQRLEFYGEERSHDNELFSTLAYTGLTWLTPSINYTYATQAKGYFIELNLHSHWNVTDKLTLSPYITQSLDYQYATEQHNGKNHLQLGVEVEYPITEFMLISAHLSHSFAQQDIKQESPNTSGLNKTFFGGHLTWIF